MSRPVNPRREVVRHLRRVRLSLAPLITRWNQGGGEKFDERLENQSAAWDALTDDLTRVICELSDLRTEAMSHAAALRHITTGGGRLPTEAERAAVRAFWEGKQHGYAAGS